MSSIIILSFWRHLNDKPIKLDEQVRSYQEYWAKQSANQQPDSGDSDTVTGEEASELTNP